MSLLENIPEQFKKGKSDQNFVLRLLSNLQSFGIHVRIKTIGFLILFILAFPITFIITIFTLIVHAFTRKPQVANPNAKRILISCGGMSKSLQLVRSLYAAGHHVILTEEYSYTAHRFSRCVSRFYLSADTKDHEPYMKSIIDIVQKEKIDVFIPVSHSWNECTDAILRKSLEVLNCETIHGNIDQLQMMSDKYNFVNGARSLGLTVPKTFKITDPKQIIDFDFSKEKCRFILKSLGDDTITRWNRVKFPLKTHQETIDFLNQLIISEKTPWLLQEFIPGKEYCTHGTIRNGELRLHICSLSSPWCLNYKHVDDKPLILEWVRDFCSKINLTGQASFDFIESFEDGRPYAIECNPRTHSAITAFYNDPRVAETYLGTSQLEKGPITPPSNARETYWLHHELWNLFTARSIKDFQLALNRLIYGKEALHSFDDPLPFFFQYTVHMPLVLLSNLLNPIEYVKVDCNLGLLL